MTKTKTKTKTMTKTYIGKSSAVRALHLQTGHGKQKQILDYTNPKGANREPIGS